MKFILPNNRCIDVQIYKIHSFDGNSIEIEIFIYDQNKLLIYIMLNINMLNKQKCYRYKEML